MTSLILQQIELSIAGQPLLGPLDLTVPPGQIAAVMGPSGAGKSSLLSYICGVLPKSIAARGCILLGNLEITPLPPEQRRLGILFQDDMLFPHLSVAGNLAFGLPRAKRSRKERARLIAEALDSFGLAGFADRDPATLSGGQRARVALLRTILSQPRALLLDEPFAHLDPDTRNTVRRLVVEEIERRALPALLVTHDEEDARLVDGPLIRLPMR
ncbi:MAG: ATP-binding cassette domain-containing protein [Dehalococcoidia bacterium]